MDIDYIFPRRILSSKKSVLAKILSEWKTALKFIVHSNTLLLKCLGANICSGDF